MSRPVGITIAAVVAIVGGGASLLMGVLALAGTLMVDRTTNASPELFGMIVGVVLLVGAGTWGIATALGLLFLRRWARISILVFGGLLAFSGASAALFVFLIDIPIPARASEQEMEAIRTGMAIFYLFLLAVGSWWLYLFNTNGVKRAFLGNVAETGHAQRPLSITVIAWFLIVSGILTVAFGALRWPAMFMGLLLTGWSASLVYFLYSAAEVYLGIGLLKLKPLSRTLAVYFFMLGVLSTVFFFLLPNREARMAALFDTMPFASQPAPDTLSSSKFWFLQVLFGTLAPLLPVWFLVSRKRAYLAANKAPAALP